MFSSWIYFCLNKEYFYFTLLWCKVSITSQKVSSPLFFKTVKYFTYIHYHHIFYFTACIIVQNSVVISYNMYIQMPVCLLLNYYYHTAGIFKCNAVIIISNISDIKRHPQINNFWSTFEISILFRESSYIYEYHSRSFIQIQLLNFKTNVAVSCFFLQKNSLKHIVMQLFH